MKKNYLSIVIMGAAVCAFAGCQDELDQNKVKGGDYVPFAISEDKTRTAYDGTDAWQINWVEGDKVRVFCYEAEDVNNAEYSVTPDATTKSTGKLAPNGSGLKWGGTDNEHKFYAVYPSDASKCSVSESGIATIKMNLNQTATIGSLNGTVYSTTPDMSNAFMVAYATGKASETTEADPIKLAFKPIMTTLEITVQGKKDENTTVKLTGISLSMEVPTEVASTGSFQYDIANKRLITGDAGSTSTTTETIFVNLVTTGDNTTNALTLEHGQSVKITAFLPPVPVDSTNKVKVRVHATGENELTVTLGKTKDGKANIEIGASNKATNITLPEIDPKKDGNNWITPLDDNIYVSQMSIPGSHDAATGEKMATIIGDALASTQELTLNKQWTLGVRAFDLRPAIYNKVTIWTSDDELWLYHGMTRVDISWASAMNTIKAQLASNPGEFAIVLFRHESEATASKNNSDTDFNTYMTNYVNQNKDWIVDWKPDLTIGEARGKIILISRFSGNWEYGCFTGWGHGSEGVTTTLNNASNTLSATMYVQDYYDPSSLDAKWNSIKTYLDISRTFHTDQSKKNNWMINHCSGYVGASTSSTYRNNAAYQNPKLIEYLNSSSWEGSTGIILFDYTGASLSNGFIIGSTEVYGDVALQTIIDNNYKYRMLRKGE